VVKKEINEEEKKDANKAITEIQYTSTAYVRKGLCHDRNTGRKATGEKRRIEHKFIIAACESFVARLFAACCVVWRALVNSGWKIRFWEDNSVIGL
jgi:hypothetical protein